MRRKRDLVGGAGVVKTRSDVDRETHLPAHGKYSPHHAVPVCRYTITREHEVLHLPHPAGREEARDQDVGVR